MKKKEMTKTLSKKATTTTSSKEVIAKVSKNQVIEVVVTAKKFGTYKKGDIVKMHYSTAMACIKNEVVIQKK